MSISSLVNGPLSVNSTGDFVDQANRKVTLKGINLDASAKFPFTPFIPSNTSSTDEIFWDGENISFVGRPFPLKEARFHFEKIKSWGFNIIRYIITWEALEHKGPGEYDLEFIDYTIEVLKIIKSIGGLYVIIDPHQDVWSRFSGGSGAPLWTFYAAGFEPRNFRHTGAAILHGDFYVKNEDEYEEEEKEKDPSLYAKMLWPTNYHKLACLTMFTLFFCGKMFAPNSNLNGVNIQDYLQDHFMDSFQFLLKNIEQKASYLFDDVLFAFESMNEPNKALYGNNELDSIPKKQILRVGPTPTFLQSVKLGMGQKCEVEKYKITLFGPKKFGTQVIDPKGVKAWISEKEGEKMDEKYGWERDPNWKLGKCLWEQNGVWDSTSGKILNMNYFDKEEKFSYQTFADGPFVDYFLKYVKKLHDIKPELHVLMQSVVLETPPRLKGKGLIDNKIIFAPHYYDGLTLMSKKWNKYYNVDTLGIMREKYINPIFAIVLGEKNIKKCFKQQFLEIKKESKEYLGEDIAIIMSETGMPFDMDNKKAFKENNYISQTLALDALSFGLEGSDISHTWWTYCYLNSHDWGDAWNCEDFSFYSPDDVSNLNLPSTPLLSIENDKNLPEESDIEDVRLHLLPEKKKDEGDTSTDHDGLSSYQLNSYALGNAYSVASVRSESIKKGIHPATQDGVRAANAVIRPYAVKINGIDINAEFDLNTAQYKLYINKAKTCFTEINDQDEKCTEIFLPEHHYQKLSNSELVRVEVSSGNYSVDPDRQVLIWNHDEGQQYISIQPLVLPSGIYIDDTPEDWSCLYSYLEKIW